MRSSPLNGLGRWGSGKSFLVQLLKWEFDADLTEDPLCKDLTQRFEEEVEGEDAEEQQPQLIDSCPSSTQAISTAALQMSDLILQSIKLSTELERSTLIRSEKICITHHIEEVLIKANYGIACRRQCLCQCSRKWKREES